MTRGVVAREGVRKSNCQH